MMRILCLDYGEKRIGVAVSDPLGITAQPLEYILNEGKKKVLLKVKEFILKYKPVKIIIGMPLTLKGEEGEKAQEVSRFMGFLKDNIEIQIEAIDERFTTALAENLLIEADVRRAKRKQVKDKIAAALILQTYLDKSK